MPVQTPNNSEYISNKVTEYIKIYMEAPYVEWLLYRFHTEVLPILYQLPLTMIPILGSFLLGLYAGKKNLYDQNEKNLQFVKSCWKWSFIISTPIVILNSFILSTSIHNVRIEQGLSHFLTSVSGLSLSIFYMASLFILISNTNILKFFIPFRFVGQMALTNYLLQSIVSIGLYRLFHLYMKISLVEGTIISLIIFCVQLVFSYYWLTYFHNGPAEWLWRSFTYGKLMPFKKKPHTKLPMA
jgi:uncharacterized protein